MIKDNIGQIKEEIRQTCAKINCDPETITIVAVSKGRSVEQVIEAAEEGITDIGENRVQEAKKKFQIFSKQRNNETTKQRITWHMVGHLQSNKVKEAVRIFDLIQSVDSLHLAEEIDKQAAKINKVQDILVEIKTSPEANKFGLNPEEAVNTIKEIAKLKNINLKGLMTIAPLVDAPEKTRPYFKMLRELSDRINETTKQRINETTILSMGMTDDYKIAIEEGSTMVRLGRAIFGY